MSKRWKEQANENFTYFFLAPFADEINEGADTYSSLVKSS